MNNSHEYIFRFLIGKTWQMAAEILAQYAFYEKWTAESLINSLYGENRKKIVDGLNRMNEGYREIIDLFGEMAICNSQKK